MISIIFSKGSSFFSDLITSATDEQISHVAIRYGDFVIQSNLRGVHVTTYENFLKKSSIYDEIEVIGGRTNIMRILSKYEFSFYDFGGFLFLGFSLFARKYLKIPLPKSNLWQSTGMFLCTEFIAEYLDIEEDVSMWTPGDIHRLLKKESALP